METFEPVEDEFPPPKMLSSRLPQVISMIPNRVEDSSTLNSISEGSISDGFSDGNRYDRRTAPLDQYQERSAEIDDRHDLGRGRSNEKITGARGSSSVPAQKKVRSTIK